MRLNESVEAGFCYLRLSVIRYGLVKLGLVEVGLR